MRVFRARGGDLEEVRRDVQGRERARRPRLRQGIKEFSAWPTIPQVYVDGKFLGGSDILMEMFQSGELAKLVTPPPA